MATVFVAQNRIGLLLPTVTLVALGLLLATPTLAVDLPSSDLPPECQAPQPFACASITTLYSSDEELHGIFPGPIDLTNVIHSCFTSCSVTHVGGDEQETFDSKLNATIDIGAGPEAIELQGPVEVTTFGRSEGELGTFPTEMVSLQLTGSVGGVTVEIDLDPAETSSGSVTISDNGNGTFDVDSFFDVSTRISIDGSSPQPQTNGPTTMTLTSTAPAPALGVVGVMATLAAMGTVMGWRRWRATTSGA